MPALNLSEYGLAVLATIAHHQPISRAGLKEIFGKDISRDQIGRLSAHTLQTRDESLAGFVRQSR